MYTISWTYKIIADRLTWCQNQSINNLKSLDIEEAIQFSIEVSKIENIASVSILFFNFLCTFIIIFTRFEFLADNILSSLSNFVDWSIFSFFIWLFMSYCFLISAPDSGCGWLFVYYRSFIKWRHFYSQHRKNASRCYITTLCSVCVSVCVCERERVQNISQIFIIHW